DECWHLLSQHDVGRLAVNIPEDAPMVVPVNYVVDGRVIVFRSDPGTKIDALRTGPISFQLDEVNPSSRLGWSVLISGVAYEATPDEIAHLRLTPWTDGDKRLWVRLIPRTVTGRRITLAEYVPTTHR